ncbi:MAG TPA: hypothetical protein VKW08_20145 [Xanthobacteraceae bacterium]|nr:hypothetical protein [Xanthobacteraceae bacterium]
MPLTLDTLYSLADRIERAAAILLDNSTDTEALAPELKDLIVQALREYARQAGRGGAAPTSS